MRSLYAIGLSAAFLLTHLCAQQPNENIPEMDADVSSHALPDDLAADFVDPVSVEKNPAFIGGEALEFKLGWGIFSVAEASMVTVPDQYEGTPALRITLTARTNSFADAFYKVRNTSKSWLTYDVSGSLEYAADQNEGGRVRDTRAIFDPENLTVRYVNNLNGENRDPVSIIPGTFDPLGIVFFARSLDFDVGDRLVVPTSNGKEFFYTIIHVTGKVERRFRYGKREAYVLEPDIKDIGGVFKRSPNGSIRFYISADEQKLPLRMESEVAVGKFWAELVSVGQPADVDSVAVAEIE